MNSVPFECSLDREYPTAELGMANFTEHNSVKDNARDEGVRTNIEIVNFKTEDCTNFGDTSSVFVSELKQEDEVRITDSRYVLFYFFK